MKNNYQRITLEEIVREKIKENEQLFSEEELNIINHNLKMTKKIYLLAIINGKQIYGNHLQ